MLFSYLVLLVEPVNEPAREIPVLLPPSCSPSDARWMYHSGKPVAEGLVEFTAENGEVVVNCYNSSSSTSLLKSRKEVDDALMKDVFKYPDFLPV